MARKSSASQISEINSAATDSELPEGFVNVVPERLRVYVKPVEGLMVQGVIMGRFERRGDDEGFFYQLALTEPCASVRMPDPSDEKKFVDGSAEVGAMVSLDERTDMSGWRKFAETPDTYEGFVKFVNKEPIGGGKTLWRVKCGIRPLSKAGRAALDQAIADIAERG